MARTFVTLSGPDSTCMADDDEIAGARVIADDWVSVGAGLLMSGCVCCILTVAFGIAGLLGPAPSVGRVMRAVSFFGAAVAAGAGAGLSGTVGRGPLSDGGFGGGCMPLADFAGGSGIPACEGGRGGGGAKGLAPDGGGGGGATGDDASEGVRAGGFGAAAPIPGISMRAVCFVAAGGGGVVLSDITIFVVSFFGALPSGGKVGAGLPGRLMRTVSRFTVVG